MAPSEPDNCIAKTTVLTITLEDVPDGLQVTARIGNNIDSNQTFASTKGFIDWVEIRVCLGRSATNAILEHKQG